MPVVEIRDTIERRIQTDVNGFGYMTRRINLQEGQKFSMESIDVFNDNGIMPAINNIENSNVSGYQIYISPYPMQQKAGVWGAIPSGTGGPVLTFEGGGQAAGEPNVLYKEVGISNNPQLGPDITNFVVTRFPNDNVGATPTFNWFTPHVYLTVMVWNSPVTTIQINMSVYMKVKQTKASRISSSMGQYGELLDSQIKRLVNTADIIDPTRVAGNTFPSWKFGGARPELMLSGATALRYYNRVASNDSQEMT
ncbi:unnamed protein product, partial [marine sediment metagenome]